MALLSISLIVLWYGSFMIPRKDSKGLGHITVRVSVAKDVQLEMLHAGPVDPLLRIGESF